MFLPDLSMWSVRGNMTAEKENTSFNVNTTIVNESDDEDKFQLLKGKL